MRTSGGAASRFRPPSPPSSATRGGEEVERFPRDGQRGSSSQGCCYLFEGLSLAFETGEPRDDCTDDQACPNEQEEAYAGRRLPEDETKHRGRHDPADTLPASCPSCPHSASMSGVQLAGVGVQRTTARPGGKEVGERTDAEQGRRGGDGAPGKHERGGQEKERSQRVPPPESVEEYSARHIAERAGGRDHANVDQATGEGDTHCNEYGRKP